MIFDHIDNLKDYEAIHKGIKMALEFIHNQNIKELDIGLYEIDGDKVFLKIQGYDTRDEEGGVWEAHKKYMDIQYMIEGAELINIANINEMNFPTQYDEKEDLWFFTGLGDSIILEEGMFTIFLPQDVHMTSLKVNGESRSVKKAVFKVLL
jgi:biofilm protein TabA